MEIIRVIAAVVDTERLTLYTEDGSTVEIPQGDVRLAKIVAHINPILAVPGAVAEVDVGYDDGPNHYAEYEQKSLGLVKFFRVAKARVKAFFEKVAPVPPQSMGMTGAENQGTKDPVLDQAAQDTVPPTIVEPVTAVKQEALTEILKHAVPASSGMFHTKDLQTGNDKGHDTEQETDTVIAMVGERIVPDAHKLAPQIVHANQKDDPMALALFMERLAAVAEQRHHSAEDLLKFMSRGDLPIADDGSIVIYKILNKEDGNTGRYRDCHSGQVSQAIGSYVHMDTKLVDPNRRNECSNGLHVARRQYLGGFSGNVCVLAKVRPEDVIAVPDYDANKMRVRGYHILFELSPDDFRQVQRDNPLNSEQGLSLLTRALRGDHPGITELVEITGHRGTGIKITKRIQDALVVKAKPLPKAKLETPVAPVVTPEQVKAPALDPKLVATQHETTKVKSRSEIALGLHHDWMNQKTVKAAQVLLDHKKKTKLGWEALGLPADTGTLLATTVAAGDMPGKGGEAEPGDAPLGSEGNAKAPQTPRERIRRLLQLKGGATRDTALAIVSIKKAAKKSWEALGVSKKEQELILRLTGADKK